MATKWKVSLINPSNAVEAALRRGWSLALKDLSDWIESELVPAMIYGGLGIDGIANTPFYKFVSSPEGLSQLGIESSEPPRLLEAYRRAFKVSFNNNTLLLLFGDESILKLMTPHPASGTGRLHLQSWLEWIVDSIPVNDAGYVPRDKLPQGSQKAIRISSAPGGLMLSRNVFGSTGSWRFPAAYQNYDEEWLRINSNAIEKAIMDQMTVFLTKRLS